MSEELVYVRTPHHLHKAVRLDGVLMTAECDNLDAVAPEHREILLTFPESIDQDALCRRCFARVKVQPDGEAVTS